MKNVFVPVILSVFFCSCSQEVKRQCVAPLPAPYSVESLTDATVPAHFSIGDFNWEEAKLALSVYSMDLYDAVEISSMTVGDTLVYTGEKMVIKNICNENGILTINDGLYEGGAWLKPNDGGTYRAVESDDYATYTHVGNVVLPFLPDFSFIDCGIDFHDPSDTIISAHKEYMESKINAAFLYVNTMVQVEGGKITNITRSWIP